VAFTRPEVALFISGKDFKGITKDFISPIINASPDMTNSQEGVFTQGKLVAKIQDNSQNSNVNIDIEFLKQKMNKPELSYKSALDWDIEELDQKRHFGTLIHFVLSKIESREDLSTTLDRIKIKQGLSSVEVEEALNYIESLFENERFSSYFVTESFNEKEIVNSKGMKLIPDKILKTSDGFTVVDFKTGQASPKHKTQVETYINTLKDMGYSNVSGEIFYTEDLSFVDVNV
jgi:hypothetical protein